MSPPWFCGGDISLLKNFAWSASGAHAQALELNLQSSLETVSRRIIKLHKPNYLAPRQMTILMIKTIVISQRGFKNLNVDINFNTWIQNVIRIKNSFYLTHQID